MPVCPGGNSGVQEMVSERGEAGVGVMPPDLINRGVCEKQKPLVMPDPVGPAASCFYKERKPEWTSHCRRGGSPDRVDISL